MNVELLTRKYLGTTATELVDSVSNNDIPTVFIDAFSHSEIIERLRIQKLAKVAVDKIIKFPVKREQTIQAFFIEFNFEEETFKRRAGRQMARIIARADEHLNSESLRQAIKPFFETINNTLNCQNL